MIMVTAYRGVKSHTGQPQSATCESTLAPGSTVAQQHLRLPLLRDKPAIQAPVLGGPSESEEASKKLFAIESGKRTLLSAPRHEENSACERAGVYGARAHRKLASAQL
jgi:hypothetical protein